MKTYRIARPYAAFILVGAPLLTAIFGWMLIQPLLPGPLDPFLAETFWLFGPMAAALVLTGIAAIVDVFNGRFVIDEDRVYAVSVIFRRELMFNEILGFTVDDRYITIKPAYRNRKKIKISRYYADSHEIIQWLADRYPDLDLESATQEDEDIISISPGWSQEERETRLGKAVQVVRVLNITAIISAIWYFFIPAMREWALSVVILTPLAALVAVKWSGGLIRYNERKYSVLPHVFFALLFPCMSICLRSIFDYELIEYGNAWRVVLPVLGVLLTVVFSGKSGFRFSRPVHYVEAAVIAAFFLAYSYGTVTALNAAFDRSVPVEYRAVVTGKRISSGKTTSYYLELSPWGPRTEKKEVFVSSDQYEEYDEGEELTVLTQKGFFGIQWFYMK
ncbi:MAG: hypothetical protein RJA20_2744 [Bacteroidota bacterium]|jgi:hypothetical protein